MIRRIRENGIREKETGAKGMKEVNGRRKKKERRRGWGSRWGGQEERGHTFFFFSFFFRKRRPPDLHPLQPTPFCIFFLFPRSVFPNSDSSTRRISSDRGKNPRACAAGVAASRSVTASRRQREEVGKSGSSGCRPVGGIRTGRGVREKGGNTCESTLKSGVGSTVVGGGEARGARGDRSRLFDVDATPLAQNSCSVLVERRCVATGPCRRALHHRSTDLRYARHIIIPEISIHFITETVHSRTNERGSDVFAPFLLSRLVIRRNVYIST